MVNAKLSSRQKLRGWLLPDRSFKENIVVGLFVCCLPFFLQWLLYPFMTNPQKGWLQNKVKDDLDLSVVVVVPSYNEEYFQNTVIPFLSSWCEQEVLTYEIVVVNDGSSGSDGQVKLPRPYQQQPTNHMKIVQLAEGSLGLGFALKYGVNEAQASRYILTVENDGLLNIHHTLPSLFNELRKTIDSSSLALNKLDALAVIGITRPETLWTTFFFMQWYWSLMKLICSRPNLESSHTRLFTASTAKFLFKTLHLETDTFDIELTFIAELLRIPVIEVSVPITWESTLDLSLLEKLMKTLTMARDTLILRLAYLLELWQIEMTNGS